MRIVIVASDLPDQAIEFAEILTSSCKVLLCIPDKYFSSKRPEPQPGLEIAWLRWPRQRNPASLIFMLRLYRRIMEWSPDLVHFLVESNVWSWVLASLLKPTPVVTTVHDIKHHPGDMSSRRVPRWFAHALIKRSDAVILHGDALVPSAMRYLPLRHKKIFTMPLVPNLRPSRLIPKRDDGIFRVLFFGRIYQYKGLKYLLQAFPLVRAKVPDIRLIIAGQGDPISVYTPLIDDMSAIEIHNRYVSHSEIEHFFAQSDLLVLPYIEASQSGPLMIALAFGLPVVVTDVGELPNLVRSTEIGLIVRPRDVRGLAAAITEIALNQELRSHFCQNARIASNVSYSSAEIAARAIEIYGQVLKSYMQH